MKKSTLLALIILTFTFSALADNMAQPPGQQSKIAECIKAAEGKRGNEREAFMKNCLMSTGRRNLSASPTATPEPSLLGCGDKPANGGGEKCPAPVHKKREI